MGQARRGVPSDWGRAPSPNAVGRQMPRIQNAVLEARLLAAHRQGAEHPGSGRQGSEIQVEQRAEQLQGVSDQIPVAAVVGGRPWWRSGAERHLGALCGNDVHREVG